MPVKTIIMESRNLSVSLGNVTSIRREIYTGIHLVIFFAMVCIFLSVMIILALLKVKNNIYELNLDIHGLSDSATFWNNLYEDVGTHAHTF